MSRENLRGDDLRYRREECRNDPNQEHCDENRSEDVIHDSFHGAAASFAGFLDFRGVPRLEASMSGGCSHSETKGVQFD